MWGPHRYAHHRPRNMVVRSVIGALAGLVFFYIGVYGLSAELSSRYLGISVGQLVVGFVGAARYRRSSIWRVPS